MSSATKGSRARTSTTRSAIDKALQTSEFQEEEGFETADPYYAGDSQYEEDEEQPAWPHKTTDEVEGEEDGDDLVPPTAGTQTGGEFYAEEDEEEEDEDEDEDEDADENEEEAEPAPVEVETIEAEAKENCLNSKPFTGQQIDQMVYVATRPNKGRCLFARKHFKPGDIIFIEAPVMVAIPSLDQDLWRALQDINTNHTLSLPPIWHLAAICSLTKLDIAAQRIVSDKFVPDPDAEPSSDVHRILQETGLALDPKRYERVLNAWRINGFGHHTQHDGLIMCNRVSNMAHSCAASVSWHFGENDCFVIRARQHLKPGEELTISYIGDEDILKATHLRRERLSGWLFTCQCDRCSNPVDMSRTFRCPDCGVGGISLKSEPAAGSKDELATTSTKCTICNANFSGTQISEYEHFEEAYIARLQETSKDYVTDVELVYQEATRVFLHHWVMFDLDTMLFEAYKEGRRWTEAAFHQQKRIDFATHVMPKVSFTVAGMYEDFGDLLSHCVSDSDGGYTFVSGFYRNTISRAYEDAFNALIVLCGSDHDYTLSAHGKFEQIMNSHPPEEENA